MEPASECKPCHEPLRTTLLRTGLIAVIIGAVLAFFRGGWARWPMASLLAFWPAFGGHWVEIFFLNWLSPRLSRARTVQVAGRIAVWFIGGCILAVGMHLTATALAGMRPTRWPAWWVGGIGFIGLELVVHLILQLRGRPSFYNGRG